MTDHLADARCGYAVIDDEGEQAPCDRPAVGWRWYQDVGDHEDALDVACDWHANEGGRRIHEAEAALADLRERVRALADESIPAAVEAVVARHVEAERERIAQEIEAELVCCDGEARHGGGICYWGSRAARIARGDAR